MKPSNLKCQNGFALLLFVVLMMGIGGFVLVGYGQGLLKEVKVKRFEHNKRVLAEAKEALLLFAYNYPVTNGNGPGRLPCPDTDNSGTPNATAFCKFIATGGQVGRFPWDDPRMNFYDARDANGELLWYAVSENFANNPNQVINSDSTGTITLVDQAGNIIYDGNGAGIAAVIIAPGTPLAGQDRIADPLDPANYLDAFNGFDNSFFNNGESDDDDGFILGPVFDPAQNSNAINDQIIVITAAEVVAMAEKATLQAYRDAIINYQQNIWPVTAANYRFPWLDMYSSADGLGTFDGIITPTLSNPLMGRLPSIFEEYFDGAASGQIQSELELEFQYDDANWGGTTPIVTVNFDGVGDLVTTSTFNPAVQTFYLWDGHATTPDALSPKDGVWELCTGTASPFTGDPEDDCNRKTDGTFKTPADTDPDESDVWLEVKLITMEFNQGGGNITFFDADLKGSPLIYEAPTGVKHALVSADYNNGSGYLVITHDYDLDFKASFGDQGDGPAFGADPDDRIRVGIRYYPVLPAWALPPAVFPQGNSWHDDVMLTYSSAVQPGGDGVCTPPAFPVAVNADYCLNLLNSGGVRNDKSALLILSGADIDGDADDGLVDGGGGPDFFADDLTDIFEGENNTDALPYGGNFAVLEDNLTYERRVNNGNDVILVVR